MEQKYFIDNKNFYGNFLITNQFGTIRYGDLVAISSISKAFKKQFKSRIFIRIDDYLKDIIDCFVPNFDGYFFNNKHIYGKLDPFPFSCNCWGVYHNLYKNFGITPNIKIEHILRDNSIINKFLVIKRNLDFFRAKYNSKILMFVPLFSTKNNNYNNDRFFPIDFCIKLLNKILNEFYSDCFIIVVGHEKNYFYKKLRIEIKVIPKNLRMITVNNMKETVYLMTLSDIYIGGDTGTTHIVSSLNNYCNNIISVYGVNSKKRHSEIEKVADKICSVKKYSYNDYTPKVCDGKKLYYLDYGFNDMTLDLMIKYIYNILEKTKNKR